MAAPIQRDYESQKTEEESKVAPLLGSIISDVQQLLRQEITLARAEISHELKRAKATAMLSALGGFAIGIAGILFGFMVAQILADITNLPLWACSGFAGAIFAAVGVGVMLRAKESAKEIDLIPRETVENVKENVQWIKNRT